MYYETWFPVDANITSDPKITALINECGWDALGWYIDILSRLRKDPDHRIEWGKKYVQISMAKYYGTTVEKLRTVVERSLNEFELLVFDDPFLFSNGMLRHMEAMSAGRKQRREAGKKSGESRRQKAKTPNGSSTGVQRPLNGATNETFPLNRVEKSREEERRGESPLPPNPISLGKASEQIIREYDGRILSFEEIVTVIEGQRDPEKIQNVSHNERGHLHKIYYADGQAEKLTQAVLELSKTPWRGTLQQIQEVMAGKKPKSAFEQQVNPATAQPPKAKSAKTSQIQGVTYQETLPKTLGEWQDPF